jgi:hypothetical protein
VEATKEALLVGTAAVVLSLSAAHVVSAVTAGRVVIEGGEAEGQRLGEGVVLACPVVIRGVKVLPMLLLLLWHPCNSFSTSIASSNKRLTVV